MIALLQWLRCILGHHRWYWTDNGRFCSRCGEWQH